MISGVFMILSIWFLPSVMGIYALLVGFTFVSGLTTVLNFILLFKKMPQKPKIFKFCLCSFLILLPTILLGEMLKKLLLNALGTFLTFLIVSTVLILFIGAMYFVFYLIEISMIRATFFNKKKKKENQTFA
jgi:hypothetical protein